MDLKSGASGAFLYVTHNVEEAFALADRIVVMVAGAIAQVDAPKDLYWQPANAPHRELTGDVSFSKSPMPRAARGAIAARRR